MTDTLILLISPPFHPLTIIFPNIETTIDVIRDFSLNAIDAAHNSVEAKNLQVGDIITGRVGYVDFSGYTVTLKGGTYGTGNPYYGEIYKIYTENRVISDYGFDSVK